jgi:hypothetical protein
LEQRFVEAGGDPSKGLYRNPDFWRRIDHRKSALNFLFPKGIPFRSLFKGRAIRDAALAKAWDEVAETGQLAMQLVSVDRIKRGTKFRGVFITPDGTVSGRLREGMAFREYNLAPGQIIVLSHAPIFGRGVGYGEHTGADDVIYLSHDSQSVALTHGRAVNNPDIIKVLPREVLEAAARHQRRVSRI